MLAPDDSVRVHQNKLYWVRTPEHLIMSDATSSQDTKTQQPLKQRFASRAEREENIRRHSDNYGVRFCTENAPKLGIAITSWKKGDRAVGSDVMIRVYNREKNEMSMRPLVEVLDSIVLDSNETPQRLIPTQFGQVVLSPTMYISTIIYNTIVAAWHLQCAS